MVLTKFIKISIAVGIATLLCLIIVAGLNIYWYSDEIEPALEDCVGPHLKMVANFILLALGLVASIVFGIITYRLSKASPTDEKPAKSEENTKSKEEIKDEVSKMSPQELLESIVGYAQVVENSTKIVQSYYKTMNENITKYLGPYPLKEPLKSFTIGETNAKRCEQLNKESEQDKATAINLYSIWEKNIGSVNLDLLVKRLGGIFINMRENAFEADSKINESKAALVALNRNIEAEWHLREQEKRART